MLTISVLMAVCGSDKPSQIDRAIKSIWDDQTRMPDQVVIVADGGLEKSIDAVLEAWVDICEGHLEIVRLKENQGLAAALNQGLVFCRCDLVARMDADDISLPERFEKQLFFMNENNDVCLSSGFVEEFVGEGSESYYTRVVPLDSIEIEQFAKKRNPISHPAVIFRRKCIMEVGAYPYLRKAQDWGLVSLLLKKGHKISNLNESLVLMRAGPDLQKRRGVGYLVHELKLFLYQKEIGFLTWRELLTNIIIRVAVRAVPSPVREFLYKNAR